VQRKTGRILWHADRSCATQRRGGAAPDSYSARSFSVGVSEDKRGLIGLALPPAPAAHSDSWDGCARLVEISESGRSASAMSAMI
jgi:hypothetical protein